MNRIKVNLTLEVTWIYLHISSTILNDVIKKNDVAQIEGLVQACSNSIANVPDLLQSCTKPSK